MKKKTSKSIQDTNLVCCSIKCNKYYSYFYIDMDLTNSYVYSKTLQIQFTNSFHNSVTTRNVTILNTIPMNKVPVMYILNTGDELVSKKENSLEWETTGAEIKQVFQRGAKQFHYHYIIVPFWAAPFYRRYANCQDSNLYEKISNTICFITNIYTELSSITEWHPCNILIKGLILWDLRFHLYT